MHFIRVIFVLLVAIKTVFPYDIADVRFEVEKVGHKRLVIKAFERSTELFSQPVDHSFNETLIFGQTIFSRHDSGYKIIYQGRDKTSLSLEVDDEGNIFLADSGV